MWRCHQCKSEWENDKRVPAFKETCPTCSAYLHCCLNCKHHDRHAHNQCRIPNTDWVGDRKGPSFCDEFEFAPRASSTNPDAKKLAKNAFGDLFGDQPPQDSASGFDDLFKTE